MRESVVESADSAVQSPIIGVGRWEIGPVGTGLKDHRLLGVLVNKIIALDPENRQGDMAIFLNFDLRHRA